MSDESGARLRRFTRRTLNIHLPVLLGLMAERGADAEEQARRACALVVALRSAKFESSLKRQGRSVPVVLEQQTDRPRLRINEKMIARVDEQALASAMVEPISDILEISAVSAGLVLRLSDLGEARGLVTKLEGHSGEAAIPAMQVGELVRWRVEIFEERLYELVEGLGGWLGSPGAPRDKFAATLSESSTRWPQWRQIEDSSYAQIWVDELGRELEGTDWGEHAESLVEMIWESLAVSPWSALRQSAQELRRLDLGVSSGEILSILSEIMIDDAQARQGNMDSWPAFEDLQRAWSDFYRAENAFLGVRTQGGKTPVVSVFESPRRSTGLSKPETLPWNLPLLCWTIREREALRDLFEGMGKSMSARPSPTSYGKLGPRAWGDSKVSLEDAAGDRQWIVEAPKATPPIDDGFSQHIDGVFAAVKASYGDQFAGLGETKRPRAISFLKGAYSGYLESSKSIWRRRFAGLSRKPREQQFAHLLTGLARALQWPIFVDPFEDGVSMVGLSRRPRFTVIALWIGEAEFAPFWIPVETIGSALDQAPLRIRNMWVDDDGEEIRWLGDHELNVDDFRALPTEGILRSLHDGVLRLVIHQR